MAETSANYDCLGKVRETNMVRAKLKAGAIGSVKKGRGVGCGKEEVVNYPARQARRQNRVV